MSDTLWEFQEIFEGHCRDLKSLSELVEFMGPHLYSQAIFTGSIELIFSVSPQNLIGRFLFPFCSQPKLCSPSCFRSVALLGPVLN